MAIAALYADEIIGFKGIPTHLPPPKIYITAPQKKGAQT
jgi:hypothetical protein